MKPYLYGHIIRFIAPAEEFHIESRQVNTTHTCLLYGGFIRTFTPVKLKGIMVLYPLKCNSNAPGITVPVILVVAVVLMIHPEMPKYRVLFYLDAPVVLCVLGL